MKKIALLLSLALLAACGGSGGGVSSSGTTPAAYTGQTASLQVVVKDSAKTTATTSPYLKHMRRLVVTNPAIVDNQGNVVKFTTPDYEIGSAPAPMVVPVATGCVVELLDYDITGTTYSNYTSVRTFVPATGPKAGILGTYSTAIPASDRITKPYIMVNYATANKDIVSGVNSVTLTLGAVTAPAMTIPAAINANLTAAGTNSYTIGATILAASPFDPANWKFTGSYTGINSPILQSVTTATSAAQLSPLAYDNQAVKTSYSIGGIFYLKNSLKKSTDTGSEFAFSSTPVATVLNSGTGTITPP